LDMVINGLDNTWDWSYTLSNRSNYRGQDWTTSNYAGKIIRSLVYLDSISI